MIKYILAFKGLCSYHFCPLPLKMNIKASHCSFMLMIVARECLIIIHSLFTAMSVFHKYVYFQRICRMELLCSIHIIFLTVGVTIASRTSQTWFNFLFHHLSDLSLASYLISLILSFPICEIVRWRWCHLPCRAVVMILISDSGSIQSRAKFYFLKLSPQINQYKPKSSKSFLTSSVWGTPC